MLRFPRKRYPSYEAASAHCGAGYEQAELVRCIVEKTKASRTRAERVLSPSQAFGVASLLLARPSRILDFGGAAGWHYFQARPLLPGPVCWRVVETLEMVRQASELANDELTFSTELAPCDFIWTSGTLQCVDAPHAWLARLLALDAGHVYFGRLGLSDAGDVHAIHTSRLRHNGPGELPPGFDDVAVRYPFVFPDRSRFLQAIGAHYEVMAWFEDDSGIFTVRGARIRGGGLLVRRR